MPALLTHAFSFILAEGETSEPASSAGFGNITLIIYIVLFVGIFYFLLIRPGQKQRKQHQEVVAAIRKGDEVMTAGGIFGTVTRVADDFLMVEIAKKTEIKLARGSIARRLGVDAAAEDDAAEIAATEIEPSEDAATEIEPSEDAATGDEAT